MTKDEILRRLRNNKVDIKDKFHAEILAIFGSYAREEQSAESDVDVLYRLDDNNQFGLLEIDGLENYLKSLFEVSTVDLVNEKYLNPIVQLEIQDELSYV